MKLSLEEFLNKQDFVLSAEPFGQCSAAELNEILTSVQVIPHEASVKAPVDEDREHNELLEILILFIMENKIDNILSAGYSSGSYGLDDPAVASQVYCKGVSFQVNVLKQPGWRLLHTTMGSPPFASLLLNCSAFYTQKGAQHQLFGKSLKLKFNPFKEDRRLTKQRFMYQNFSRVRNLNPLPENCDQLIQQVYAASPSNKKFRKLRPLFRKLISSHSSFDYYAAVIRFCPAPSKSNQFERVETPAKDVVALLLFLFEKLFPFEIVGSKSNKITLMLLISRYILGDRNTGVPAHSLIENIKIKNIPWLGSNKNFNKQGWIKKRRLLSIFVEWLLVKYVAGVLSSFFYVTEKSQSSDLAFFRHEAWYSASKPHIDRYFERYLKPCVQVFDLYRKGSFVKSGLSFGTMKILPKRTDIRFICVPFKGSSDEQFAYRHHINNEIRPVRTLLRDRRSAEKCRSIHDIPRLIASYRNSIKPGSYIFALRFDVQACYDSIPVDKVLSIVSELLRDIDTVFSRNLLSFDSNTFKSTKKIQRTVLNNKLSDIYSFLGLSKLENQVVSDRNETAALTLTDITDIIRQQVFDSAFKVGKRLYNRKMGVFQGLPLSATFCDILYDRLIEEHFNAALLDSQSTVLRLADDFLILSTNPAIALSAFKKVQNSKFSDYNMIINRNKTLANFCVSTNGYESELLLKDHAIKEILFCGLHIDLSRLDILKRLEPVNSVSLHCRSFKKLYKRLKLFVKPRLGRDLVNLKINSLEAVLFNVLQMVRSILTSFNCSFALITIYDAYSLSDFKIFLSEIVELTADILNRSNMKVPEGQAILLNGMLIDVFVETVNSQCGSIHPLEIVEVSNWLKKKYSN